MEFGPGDLFETQRKAALDWGMYYNGASIIRKQEMGSSIYEVKKDGILVGYSYSPAIIGEKHRTSFSPAPNGYKMIATIHSHGNYDGVIIENGRRYEIKDNEFSLADKNYNKSLNMIGFLATPNGSLLEHNPSSDVTVIISTQLPSDPQDPSRKNVITPTNRPYKPSIVSRFLDWLKNNDD